jgi:cytochrome P450
VDRGEPSSLILRRLLCRICLGQQFALTEAGYVTVRLLQKFDKMDGSAMEGLSDDWFLTLTGRPKHGVRVKLHVAKED